MFDVELSLRAPFNSHRLYGNTCFLLDRLSVLQVPTEKAAKVPKEVEGDLGKLRKQTKTYLQKMRQENVRGMYFYEKGGRFQVDWAYDSKKFRVVQKVSSAEDGDAEKLAHQKFATKASDLLP